MIIITFIIIIIIRSLQRTIVILRTRASSEISWSTRAIFGNSPKSRRHRPSKYQIARPISVMSLGNLSSRLCDLLVVFSLLFVLFSLLAQSTLASTYGNDAARHSNVHCKTHQTCGENHEIWCTMTRLSLDLFYLVLLNTRLLEM